MDNCFADKSKMGLLTDPSGLHSRPFRFLVKNDGKICCFLYVLAVFSYCLLSHEQVNSGTYLSENALLPGLVVVGFDQNSQIENYLNDLHHEMELHPDSIPTAWIRGKFSSMGIESFVHNFTLNYPLGKGTKFTGTNIYGIIRGGGASTEAIVMSVPYRPTTSVHPTTAPGLALMLSVAGYFRKQKYWAKDLILLVTEHEQLGVQAWLEAYHGTTCGTLGVLNSGELMGRGGSIQAAINLEMHAVKIHHIDVKLAGLNGQLPNLDLANLVHKIAAKERVRHSFANREKLQTSSAQEMYVHSFITMGSMVLSQATGVPDGNHGLYHRFGIEAVTIEGHGNTPGSYTTLFTVGRMIEGVFRSINNLLERFHQSYFFYLLADVDRFISIGLYMPCVGMLVAALFIKAFSIFLKLKQYLHDVLYSSCQSDSAKPLPYPDFNTTAVAASLLLSYSTGVSFLNFPKLFTSVSYMSTDTSLFIGYLVASLLSAVVPAVLVRRLSGRRDWVLIHIAGLIHLGTMLLAISMHNFSLAWVLGLLVCPPVLLFNTSRNGLFKKILCLAIHPLSLLTLVVTLATAVQFPIEELSTRSLSALKQAISFGVLDNMIYGSWTFSVAMMFYLPNWLMFWILVQADYTCLNEASVAKKTE